MSIVNIDTHRFLEELSSLHDEPDTADIANNPEVLDANKMAADSQTRKEGISRLLDLVNAYPASGNICSLYAQALAWDDRRAEAEAFIQKMFPNVLKKSDLACVAGIISMERAEHQVKTYELASLVYSRAFPGGIVFSYPRDFEQAIAWYLRAAASQHGKAQDEHLLLELSSVYKVMGMAHRENRLLAVHKTLQRLIGDRIRLTEQAEASRTQLAKYCDERVIPVLFAAAEYLGWVETKQETKQWWQFWR